MSREIIDQVRNDYKQILLDPQNSILTGDADNQTVSASVGYIKSPNCRILLFIIKRTNLSL